jgi:pimeloyl-ACP methyl ester carboxylesterase
MPADRFLVANRLRHHLLEWGETGPTVLLLHGFLEHAHVWDWVAPRLAEAGHHVYALDWRGHGDSQWVGAGGYYHFPDYVADLAFIVRALGGAAALVAHSMGGNAAVLYAGTEPERVWALTSIEGLGPPDMEPASAPRRFAAWVDDLERHAGRERAALSRQQAVERLHERYPRLARAAAEHLVEHGTRDEAGELRWKFDPLHQTRSPQPFYARQACHFWSRVSCPVLYVEGAESSLRLSDADLEERLGGLRAEGATIEGAGHHPHLENPEALADVLLGFLKRAVGP